jgi:hypothetical protein
MCDAAFFVKDDLLISRQLPAGEGPRVYFIVGSEDKKFLVEVAEGHYELREVSAKEAKKFERREAIREMEQYGITGYCLYSAVEFEGVLTITGREWPGQTRRIESLLFS